MLSKEMEDRISIVAAVNCGHISIQSLLLIAYNNNMGEEVLEELKDYCKDKCYFVFDELAEAEAAAMAAITAEEQDALETGNRKRLDDLDEETAQWGSVEEFIETFNFPEGWGRYEEGFKDLMRRMSLREVKVIAYRFGLTDGTVHTVEETGKKFGLTRERVRLIENKVFRRARCHLHRRKKLTDFLNS